jgi:hypothetical protein
MKRLLLLGCASLAFIAASAQARVTRIEITKQEPFAAGQTFGTVGPMRRWSAASAASSIRKARSMRRSSTSTRRRATPTEWSSIRLTSTSSSRSTSPRATARVSMAEHNKAEAGKHSEAILELVLRFGNRNWGRVSGLSKPVRAARERPRRHALRTQTQRDTGEKDDQSSRFVASHVCGCGRNFDPCHCESRRRTRSGGCHLRDARPVQVARSGRPDGQQSNDSSREPEQARSPAASAIRTITRTTGSSP